MAPSVFFQPADGWVGDVIPFETDWTATFAAVCVTVTPLLLIFLILNRAMIYGLESGASKG